MKYCIYILLYTIETKQYREQKMADINSIDVSCAEYIQPQASQEAQENIEEQIVQEAAEENIFAANPFNAQKNAKLNLDDYCYDAKEGLWLNDLTKVANRIAQDISTQLEISINSEYGYSKEFDEAMAKIYKQNKENFETYSKINNDELKEDMSTQEILETLIKMSCDGLSTDDDISLSYISSITDEDITDTDDINEDLIDKIDDEQTDDVGEFESENDTTNEAQEGIVTTDKEDETTVLNNRNDNNLTIDEANIIEEKLGVYDASKGTVIENGINMDNYCYTAGKFDGNKEKAQEQLAKDIMQEYGINENSETKNEKLDKALDDIISKNNITVWESDSKLDAVLRLGNDGVNNDLITITRHPENELTTDIPTTRRYNKETGEIISDETDKEFISYSKDNEGNKIAQVYPKDNGIKSEKPEKTITYDLNGEISKEETKDNLVIYSKPDNDEKTKYQTVKKTYLKDDNGNVINTPIKTETYDSIARIISSEVQIDKNTKEVTKYSYAALDNISLASYCKSIQTLNDNGQIVNDEKTTFNKDGSIKSTTQTTYNPETGITEHSIKCDYEFGTSTESAYGTDNDDYKLIEKYDYNNDGVVDETYKVRNDGTKEYNFDNIDHKIDYNMQKGIGDCWMLSGLKALSSTEKGQQLLDSAFTQNKDGTYSIHYKGAGKNGTDITVTPDDLAKARQEIYTYSGGDNTALLFEVGLNKLIHHMANNKEEYTCWEMTSNAPFISKMMNSVSSDKKDDVKDIVIDGANLTDMTYILFGKPGSYVRHSLESSLENFDFDNTVSYISFTDIYGSLLTPSGYPKDINGKECVLVAKHAYAVVGADKNKGTITIVNPWRNYESFTFNIKELGNYYCGVQFEYCNL